MKNLSLAGCLLIVGCSTDNPDRHLARCEIEWRGSSERVKEEWAGNEASYFRDCMSAADFEFNFKDEVCKNNAAQSRCYVSRQSFTYRITHFGR